MAMRAHWDRTFGHGNVPDARQWLTAPDWLRPSAKGPPLRPVLLTPYWPGLIANTVIYAGTVWGVCMGAATARSRWRARRGLCVKCLYEVRDLAICPECGQVQTPVGRIARTELK